MTPTVKLVTLITTVTAVGGGVVVANQVFNKEEIKPTTVGNKLKSEGFEVLNTANKDAVWEEALKDYQQFQANKATNPKEPQKTQEQLRKDCKNALDKDEAQGNYELFAKKWCVKKETMNKVLERAGYTLLKLDNTREREEKVDWLEKIKKLKQNKKQFKGIEAKIKDGEAKDDNTANIGFLKEECKKLKIDNTHTTDDAFENNLTLAMDWCSVKTIDKQN